MKQTLEIENIGETPFLDKKPSKKKLIIIISTIISAIFLIDLIILMVYFVTNKKKEEGPYEIYLNIPTSENKIIRNSFKKGCENYNETLGNINEGKDYNETDRDNFDICIPKDVNKRKDNYNAIYLNIHGGGWVEGDKANVSELCDKYGSKGIICTSMSYTLLNGNYKEYNIFRILDEITATIKGIKKFLGEKGFDQNKLELFISGGSAGAHLALLYSYAIKNSPIPIKFILDGSGPVSLEHENWLTTSNITDSLESIEPESINEAKNEGRLIQMNGTETGVVSDNIVIVKYMNDWAGRYNESNFDEIFISLETKEINETSEKYQELVNLTRFAYPTTYITNKSIPTLCIYGGKDQAIGVDHYALLKEQFVKNNNPNISLAYFRYGSHNPFDDPTEYGKNATIKFYALLDYYMNTYLDSFKNKNN